MIYNRYMDIHKFIEDTFDVLLANEAENNMLIGNALLCQKQNSKNWFMATVCDNQNNVLLTALQMPLHYVVLYETNNTRNDDALSILAEHMIGENINLPGVLSEKVLAHRFSDIYCNACDICYKIDNSMQIMKVTDPKPFKKVAGQLRLATEKDLFYLPFWDQCLRSESGLDPWPLKNVISNTQMRINSEHLYIWENDIPLSTASIGRELLNGVNINGAFTPPMYRNNGYSTSCIAAITALALDNSKNKFCCVFVGADHDVANKIYKVLGYHFICDFDGMKFLRMY